MTKRQPRKRRHSPDKTRLEFLCPNADVDYMYQRVGKNGSVPGYLRALITADRMKYERNPKKLTIQ